MVGRVGLEPTANGLKGRCSTIELPTRGREGRNRTDDKRFAISRLTTWLLRVGRARGFSPPRPLALCQYRLKAKYFCDVFNHSLFFRFGFDYRLKLAFEGCRVLNLFFNPRLDI